MLLQGFLPLQIGTDKGFRPQHRALLEGLPEHGSAPFNGTWDHREGDNVQLLARNVESCQACSL